MPESWKHAVLEGAMVLVGVLLALFLDSWREDREFQHLVEASEVKIVEEIRSNHERLISYREDFLQRQARLPAWVDGLDGSQGLISQLDGFPGIPSTFINHSAWSMANNGQITEHLNHEFYDAAFSLYASGEVTESRLDLVLNLFFDVEAADPAYNDAIVSVLELYVTDIVSNLEFLIRDHKKFLERFDPPS